MVTRVIRLYQPLRQFFTTEKSTGERFNLIKEKFNDPRTLFYLEFLADVLKPLKEFELLFQKVIIAVEIICLLHKLKL